MLEQSPPTLMLETLWWVIPGYLAGAAKPREADLPMLRRQGIGAVVSLLSDESNLMLYEQHGMDCLWLPIEGGMAPTLEQCQKLREFVAVQHGAIAIHCSSGRRRTGTMLAALLIQQGKRYDEAMAMVLAANPTIDLRQPQINFLQGLAKQRRPALA